MSSFSASYTSFLSVVTQAEPFKTIPELEQTNFKVGAQSGTAFQAMFTVSGTLWSENWDLRTEILQLRTD